MIIWLNGAFGAGKTTLAQELHRRRPDALVFDPEQVGSMLWRCVPPNGDFQHLPSWRELVVATALSLRRHHAQTLIVPMSLIRDAYRSEILGGLADAGEEVLLLRASRDAIRAALRDGGVHTLKIIPYRRRGSTCPRDHAPMRTGPVDGRTSWWCSAEQLLPAASG